MEVLEALILASERAANVARSCCLNCKESLIVAEKCGGDANSRFDKDFKTIADVLAQESARYEIQLHCPELTLRGEECAEINGVKIQICESIDRTTDLLGYLVSPEAAKRMAEAAHGEIKVPVNPPKDINLSLNPADLGVWIDPIDATAEFISGVRGEADENHGLPCVTVLIGAYLRSSGEPVIGVINQPFVNNGEGRIIWGVSHKDTKIWSGRDTQISENRTILMSAAENADVIEQFKSQNWEMKSAPGAGHKLLKVALGEAAAYIVSKGTTFRWDTCAPHAILKARGGNILDYNTYNPITYNDPENDDIQQYANSGGIIAFTDEKVWNEIKEIIKN